MMKSIFDRLTEKKKKLDALPALPSHMEKNLTAWLDVEYTYTSNWIEGNTLTREQTALVLEKGITVEGKTLREHLEVINHQKAIDFIRRIVKGHQYITEQNIKDIHKIILTGIDDRWAGIYRQTQVFIRGASIEPPPPNEVPWRMRQMIEWLERIQGEHPMKVAADFHFRFVAIHPFIDGNGRTGRLLMNLVLLGHGYPMAIIKTEEREQYMKAIGEGTLTGALDAFSQVIAGAVDRSLSAHIAAAKGKPVTPYFIEKQNKPGAEYFIGVVAKKAGVSIPTVRYYVAFGLITPVGKSPGGFLLFNDQAIERIGEIKRMQKEDRLSIEEIKKVLAGRKAN